MSNTKNKNLNRFLSILLVFCMIFSMIPNIFAADVNKTFNIKLTWDHTNNTSEEKPDSVNVIIKSASSETSSITSTIKKMTLSKDGDLNLDNDPNTWEFSFEAKVTSYHKYFYIYEAETSEATLGFYDCTGAVTTSESVCNLNATCKYVTYYHQVEIIQKWIDNDNSYNQRPDSTPVKFSGKLTKHANDSTLKEINQSITINESEVVKTDNNTWVYTTATIQTRFPYIDISDYHLGNNYTTYVNFPTTADTVIANGLNKTTIVIEHKHDLAYDLNFSASWSDFSNYFNVRPETITLDIYGTNDINDKENGEYLGSTQLTAANNYTVKDGFYFASEKYDYIYVKSTLSNYDKTNGEYSHPIVTITKPNTVHSSSQSITNIPLNLYQTATLTVNFTPDMVNAPDNMEIKKAYVDIIHKEKVIKTIELTPDSNGVWTKTDTIDVATTSIKAQLRLNDLQTKYTIPTIDINQTLKDSKIPEAFTVDISTEYIDLNKNVSFNITKTWDDFNNKYNERPEEITVNLYGSYKENQGKELIASQVISVEDDLNKDNNPNTWEYIISGIENKYNYYYAEEVIDNSTILGSYELSSNTIEENIITNNNVEENNLIEENNNQIAQPMAFYPDYICIYKTWDDQNNINNSRPEYIDISVYTNSEDNEETKSLWFKVRLFEDDYELLEDPNDFESEFCYAYDWNFEIESFGYTLPDYIWVEEEIPAEGYKSTVSTSTSSYRGNNVSIYIVNTYFAPVSYNVNLTNTYTAPPRKVQFDIVKTWVDNDDDLSLRPTSIELEIYGTNVEGTTEGGELLKTITLTYKDKTEDNIWSKTANIETIYNYFYIKEKSIDNYTSTISPIQKINSINIENNSTVEQYEINITNTVIPPERDVQFKIKKIWEDEFNKYNARGPVTVEIFGTNTKDATSGGEFIGSFIITEEDAFTSRIWEKMSPVFSTNYEYFYIEEKLPEGSRYIQRIEPLIKVESQSTPKPHSLERPTPYVWMPPAVFSINIYKTWEDNDNAAGKRPEFVDFKVYYSTTSENVEDMEPYAKFRLFENEVVVIEDPFSRFTEEDSLIAGDWQACLTSNNYDDRNAHFYVEEVIPASYSSEINQYPYSEGDAYGWETYVYNNYCIETYEGTIANIYDKPRTVQFEIVKTWEDLDNKYNLRPLSIQVEIYGVENEGATTGGQLLDTIELTYKDQTSKNTWRKRINELETDYQYFYVKEINGSNNYTTSISPVRTVAAIYDNPSSANEVSGNEVPADGEYVYDVYMVNEPVQDAYQAIITNTIIPPERDVQFEITKIWDDKNNKYNSREEITIEVYGTNVENETADGELIGSFTISEQDAIDNNTWKKTSPVFSTSYEYFYISENFEGENYITSISPLTKLAPPTIDDYSLVEREPISTYVGGYSSYSILVKKTWEDDENAAGKRPEFVDFNIYYNETEDNYDNKKLYCKARLYEDDIEILEDPTGVLTPSIGEDWSSMIYSVFEHSEWNFWVEEAPVINYVSDIMYIPGVDNFDRTSYLAMINTYYVETYTATITNTYEAKRTIDFEITKTWDDFNNSLNSRPESIQVQIFGVEIEGATSGGTLIDTITITKDDAINNNTWKKVIKDLETDFEHFYIQEINDGNIYTAVISPVVKLQNDTSVGPVPSLNNAAPSIAANNINEGNEKIKDTYQANLTNKLDSINISITKIWEDEDDKYYTRPDQLKIYIYQNGIEYKTLTFTPDYANASNNNIWETTITVPKYDINGNEYTYTITEDTTNLSLDFYYYDPVYSQESLKIVNKGNWLPPIYTDDNPIYEITFEKEFINNNNNLATSEDFKNVNLDINDTYKFPIVLKELNKTFSKGETSMLEHYNGYSGKILQGILTNKGQLIFSVLEPGKYEISEIVNQYFDFEKIEEIELTEGAKLTKENDKYYITLSGLTETDEKITVKVINKIIPERYYQDESNKTNLFLIHKSGINHDTPEE